MLLLIRVVEHNEGLLISVKGEVDFASAGIFSAAVRDGLRSGHSRMVVDLESVTFMDCAALRNLAAAILDITY